MVSIQLMFDGLYIRFLFLPELIRTANVLFIMATKIQAPKGEKYNKNSYQKETIPQATKSAAATEARKRFCRKNNLVPQNTNLRWAQELDSAVFRMRGGMQTGQALLLPVRGRRRPPASRQVGSMRTGYAFVGAAVSERKDYTQRG